MSYPTPIALCIYKRAGAVSAVLASLRALKPASLYVIGDGPKPGEEEKVAAARRALEGIDWPCTVETNFAPANLGLARRITSGLDWVFAQREQAVILEDDCVPAPGFFRYAAELLERFADDERLMAVSGDNFIGGYARSPQSYYFSRYPHCWGWATWRRAWSKFDYAMAAWPAVRDEGWLTDVLVEAGAVRYWTQIFEDTYCGKIDSWAYRWTFACWLNGGLTALPRTNLVTNIGFGPEATHTLASGGEPVTADLAFPLVHPVGVIRDLHADALSERVHFKSTRPPLAVRAARKLKALLGGGR